MDKSLQNPLVSIAIATYNGARYLREQIHSILQQTYSNIEMVISDDGSTDDTLSIIKTFQQTNHNIRLLRQAKNLGYIKNFEQAMLHCEGAYIALSDQDDIWLPEKIETLLNGLGNHTIIYGDSQLIDDLGNDMRTKMSEVRNTIDYNNPIMYAIGAWAPGHAMLFRRSLLEACVPFPTLVTHDFWLGFVASGSGNVHYLDQPLVLYRQHSNNAIGAVNVTRKKSNKKNKAEKLQLARQRMHLLYTKCPAHLTETKKAYQQLDKSYQSFSISNNLLRVSLFLKHRHLMVAYKKKTELMKIMYCLKMFFKIV